MLHVPLEAGIRCLSVGCAGAGLALVLFYAWVKFLKKKRAAKSAA